MDKVNGLTDAEDRLRCKKNLLLTNLKKEEVPNKQTIFASPVKKTRALSQAFSSDSVSGLTPFNSLMSNHTNQSIV